MPVLAGPRMQRTVPEFYSSFPVTSPGITIDPPSFERTHIGTPTSSDIPFWEQLRFLSACTERLGLPLRARHESTGSNFFIVYTIAETPSEKPSPPRSALVPSLQEQVASIRSAFSLQMKELAQALDVERPTVYSWLNDRNTPHAANRDRLHALYRVAQQWNELSHDPLGKAIHEADTHGVSIFSLLTQEPLPVAMLQIRLAEAARRSVSAAPRLGQGIRDRAAKHGIDLRHVADRQDEIDLETGKGTLPE
jgi:transcriptional regulator with XRE-family HTH domain